MSQYLNFYIREKDNFIHFYEISASSVIFPFFRGNGLCNYGKVTKITFSKLREIVNDVVISIQESQDDLARSSKKIEVIEQSNNSLEEKMEALHSILEEEREIKERLEFNEHLKIILDFFMGIIEDFEIRNKYSLDETAPYGIYCGFENEEPITKEIINE